MSMLGRDYGLRKNDNENVNNIQDGYRRDGITWKVKLDISTFDGTYEPNVYAMVSGYGLSF